MQKVKNPKIQKMQLFSYLHCFLNLWIFHLLHLTIFPGVNLYQILLLNKNLKTDKNSGFRFYLYIFAFELNHWIVWQMLTGRNRPIRNRKNRQPIIEPTNNSILYSEQMLHKYCMTGFKALSLIAQCLNVKVAIFLIIGL